MVGNDFGHTCFTLLWGAWTFHKCFNNSISIVHILAPANTCREESNRLAEASVSRTSMVFTWDTTHLKAQTGLKDYIRSLDTLYAVQAESVLYSTIQTQRIRFLQMLHNVRKCVSYKRWTKALGNMILYWYKFVHIASFFVMIAYTSNTATAQTQAAGVAACA